jgi:hypothetical protein
MVALKSRTKTLQWYERGCGMKYEGTFEEFGIHGEDAVCYAVTRRSFYGIDPE